MHRYFIAALLGVLSVYGMARFTTWIPESSLMLVIGAVAGLVGVVMSGNNVRRDWLIALGILGIGVALVAGSVSWGAYVLVAGLGLLVGYMVCRFFGTTGRSPMSDVRRA